MGRWLRMSIVLGAVGAAVATAQPGGFDGGHRTDLEYDGRFTFVRLRWGSEGGSWRGMSNAWNHDYPRAEQHLARILDEVTLIDTHIDGSRIISLDDPDLFRYPIAYMWEPGFWRLTDLEARKFGEYLTKGGFAIFDDFDGQHWYNFEAQMRRVLPNPQFHELDKGNPVFDTFFRMKTIDFPDPQLGISPTYYGIYEDNDPSKRLMVVANYNADVAEYWEWSGTGLFPFDTSNEAYKLGVNYMIYGLTH